MAYVQHYDSPLGGILLTADESGITGLWFDGQKYFARDLPAERVEQNTPALAEAKRWLDIYFTGGEPDFTPPAAPHRLRVPAGGVEYSVADPLWTDHDLR